MKSIWYSIIALFCLVIIVYFIINKNKKLNIPLVGGCSTCSNPSETFSNDFTEMNQQMIYTTTTKVGVPSV